MEPNQPTSAPDSETPKPLTPGEIKEGIYSALKKLRYVYTDKPRDIGYQDCMQQDGIEISVFDYGSQLGLKALVSVFVDAPEDADFSRTHYDGPYFLIPREDLFITNDNLPEILERLEDLGEKGRKIIDSNPDKRIE